MKPSNADIHKKIQANAPIFQGARRSDISMQIRCKMAEKGLKNVDIASRLGVSEANVSRWLRGNQNLGIDTIYQLADALEEPLHICVGAMEPAAHEEACPAERRTEYGVETAKNAPEGAFSNSGLGAKHGSNVIPIFAQMRKQGRKVEPSKFSIACSENGIVDFEELMVK